jgi:hypothetical protein
MLTRTSNTGHGAHGDQARVQIARPPNDAIVVRLLLHFFK